MINKIVRLILLPLLLVVLLFSPKSLFSQKKKDSSSNIFLADPTIFYNNSTYYLYGTGAGKYADGFAAYTSSDLKKWKGPVGISDGFALKKGDAYGDSKFWAPQVFEYNNKFYIAYAANEHIGIAVSDNPLGPFKQDNHTAISEDIKQIDPFIFIDDDRKKYLYYVIVANGGNRIFVAEINDDILSVKKETEKLCIEATSQWENTANAKWSVTEGPTVIKHKGFYYLLYSANDFRNIDYAVGYAVSKSPLGPWKKYEGNPIIHRNMTGKNGSGHGDIVKGKNGDLFYVFHTHNAVDKVAPRRTAIIKMQFKNNKSGIDKLAVSAGSFYYLSR
jgi:beta-xylosidase